MGPTFSILSHSHCYNDVCDCKKNNPKNGGLNVKKPVNLRKVSFQGSIFYEGSIKDKENRKVAFENIFIVLFLSCVAFS